MSRVHTPEHLRGLSERQFHALVGDDFGLHVRVVPPSLKLAARKTITQNIQGSIEGFAVPGGCTRLVVRHRDDPDQADQPDLAVYIDPSPTSFILESSSGWRYRRTYAPPRLNKSEEPIIYLSPGETLDEAILGETFYLCVDRTTDGPGLPVEYRAYGYSDDEPAENAIQTLTSIRTWGNR